jgi:hypothetical protein
LGAQVRAQACKQLAKVASEKTRKVNGEMNHKSVFETQFEIASGDDSIIKAVLRSEGNLSVELELALGEQVVQLVTDRDTLAQVLRYSPEPDSDTIVIPSSKDHWAHGIRVNRRVVEDFLAFSKRTFALRY